MEDEVQIQSVNGETEGPGFISNFVNIFVNPHKTFAALDQKPTWLFPMIIMVLLSMAVTYISFPIIIQNQMESFRNNPNISAEQLEVIEQRMDQGGDSQKYIGVGIQLVVIPILYLLIAAMFYFVGSVLLAGKASFIKVFAVWAWSSLIGVVAIIVKTPLILLKENIKISISPALLLPGDAVDSTLFNILSQFDFFLIWQLAVFAYGFSIIYRFSTTKSYLTIGLMWAIWIVIAVAASGLFKQFGIM